MRKNPAWLENAVFYEIYPQSFYDSNGDGIGDINGIIEKLDYIKSLGCNAIWLNPCFESPFGDAGYDVSDFCKIAERYGTNDDAKRLFDKAHEKGMHVIFDLVPGHTSIEHPWYKESQKADKNEFTDRYIWTDDIWAEIPKVSDVSGWIRGLSERNGSSATNFFFMQPALNYGFYKPCEKWQQGMNDPGPRATKKAIFDAVKFWLDMGCDGFRVDMASTLIKNDEDCKGIIEFWQGFFSDLHVGYPDAAFVSEWGDPYYSIQSGFDMDFLLHFGPSHYMDLFRINPYFAGGADGDISEFVATYRKNMEKTDGNGLMCIPSGNHDMKRISYMLDGDAQRLAFAFILSMPGAPFIYYGDEIGMRYIAEQKSVEGGYERTGSRTPMQWDNSPSAGFSAATPDRFYLPLDSQPSRPSVESATEDKNSLWHEIENLIKIRRKHPALGTYGKIEFIYAEKNRYPFVYLRFADNENILVAVNPSAKEEKVNVEYKKAAETVYYYGGAATLSDGVLSVPAKSITFIKL